MNNNLLSNDDLKDILEQINEEETIETILEIEETVEMKAARKRYEEYILKHKED